MTWDEWKQLKGWKPKRHKYGLGSRVLIREYRKAKDIGEYEITILCTIVGFGLASDFYILQSDDGMIYEADIKSFHVYEWRDDPLPDGADLSFLGNAYECVLIDTDDIRHES